MNSMQQIETWSFCTYINQNACWMIIKDICEVPSFPYYQQGLLIQQCNLARSISRLTELSILNWSIKTYNTMEELVQNHWEDML